MNELTVFISSGEQFSEGWRESLNSLVRRRDA